MKLKWWKMWSMQMAGIASALLAYLTANPEQTAALLALLPDGPWRTISGIVLGFVTFLVIKKVRMTPQSKPDEGE